MLGSRALGKGCALAALLAVFARRRARETAWRALVELLAALLAAVRRRLAPRRPPLEAAGATSAAASEPQPPAAARPAAPLAPLAPLVSPAYHPPCSLAPADALALGGGFAWGGGEHVGSRAEQQDAHGVEWAGCAHQREGAACSPLAGWPLFAAGGRPGGAVVALHVVSDGHGKHGRAVARFVVEQLGRALRDAARALGADASAEAAFARAFVALDDELFAADAWLRADAAAAEPPREGDASAAVDLAAGARAARELLRLGVAPARTARVAAPSLEASAAGQQQLPAPRAACATAERARAWRTRSPSERRGARPRQTLGRECSPCGGGSPASPAPPGCARGAGAACSTSHPPSPAGAAARGSPHSPDGPDWAAGPDEWGGEQIDDGLSAPATPSAEGSRGGSSLDGESSDSEAEFQAARARAAAREDARRGLVGRAAHGAAAGARRALARGGASAAICAESGCTALAALVLQWADGSRRAVLASAGDCRALYYVVPAGGGPALARSLLPAHTPASPSERARLERAGGWATAGGRVSGLLRASRALGDSAFKRVAGRALQDQPVTALPDVVVVELPRATDAAGAADTAPAAAFALLLLVSDGVSDVLADAQVLAYTRVRAHAKRPLPRIAEGLARACARADRPSAGDNATVVIIASGDLGADRELSVPIFPNSLAP